MFPLRDHLPTKRTPVVTYALVAVNVLAYLWESAAIASGQKWLLFDLGFVPARFLESPSAELSTVFSSMFLHAPETWWHLAGNMLFLWIFGDNVEDALGRARFTVFYLLCGFGAALVQLLADPTSRVPMVGASGAIAGVLAAYGSLHPTAPVTVLNPVPPLWLIFGPLFRLPAWLVILEFFLVNLVSGVSASGSTRGGVAFFAHLGGFMAGMLLVRLLFDPQAARRQATAEAWQPPARMADEPAAPVPRSRFRGSPRW